MSGNVYCGFVSNPEVCTVISEHSERVALTLFQDQVDVVTQWMDQCLGLAKMLF